MVAAIENGTVIDHIPCAKLFEVVRLLHLEEIKTSSIMVGFNLKSHKMGRKSIIKISDKFFSDAELNRLAIVAPNVSLCIIKDYEVVEKKKVTLPGVLRNAKPNMKILHPLPRVNEIAYDVDDDPHAYYFEQARNGLYAREAIICDVLGLTLEDVKA